MNATTPEQQTTGESFVPVMVPASLVTDVYGFIAERTAAASSEEPTEAGAADLGGMWSVEQLQKVTRSSYATMQRVAAVLDHLATVPETWVPTSELVAATGLTRDQLQAAWVKLTRHLEKHYAGAPWPLDAQWGPDADLPLPQTYYRVGTEQASRWKAARASA